jgi:hypothetical protein
VYPNLFFFSFDFGYFHFPPLPQADYKQAQFAVWNTCLPNVYVKIPMFVAFAKMKNSSIVDFAKAITSSEQIGLACCYHL